MKYRAWILKLLPPISLLGVFSLITLAGKSYAWMAISGIETRHVGISVQINGILSGDEPSVEAPEELNIFNEQPLEEPQDPAPDGETPAEPQVDLPSSDEPNTIQPDDTDSNNEPVAVPQDVPNSSEASLVDPLGGCLNSET